jgi:hypothetical protein
MAAEVAGAASLGHQALEAHREREEAKSRKVWLHAWHDPVAGLKAFSSCVRLADLNGDGDCKLLVAGMDRKLRVYKGTSLLSENILLDEPVRPACLCRQSSRRAATHAPACSVPRFTLRTRSSLQRTCLRCLPTECDMMARVCEESSFNPEARPT